MVNLPGAPPLLFSEAEARRHARGHHLSGEHRQDGLAHAARTHTSDPEDQGSGLVSAGIRAQGTCRRGRSITAPGAGRPRQSVGGLRHALGGRQGHLPDPRNEQSHCRRPCRHPRLHSHVSRRRRSLVSADSGGHSGSAHQRALESGLGRRRIAARGASAGGRRRTELRARSRPILGIAAKGGGRYHRRHSLGLCARGAAARGWRHRHRRARGGTAGCACRRQNRGWAGRQRGLCAALGERRRALIDIEHQPVGIAQVALGNRRVLLHRCTAGRQQSRLRGLKVRDQKVEYRSMGGSPFHVQPESSRIQSHEVGARVGDLESEYAGVVVDRRIEVRRSNDDIAGSAKCNCHGTLSCRTAAIYHRAHARPCVEKTARISALAHRP